MQLTAIPPIAALETVASRQTFHLVLVHLLESSPIYANFYRKCRDRGDFILLDNSAYELGAAAEDDLLLKWIEELRPNEFVLPDVRMRPASTILRTQAFIERCKTELSYLPQFAAVAQGETYSEWRACMQLLLQYPEVKTIAVIAETMEFFPGGRRELLDQIQDVKERTNIHLLGTDDDLIEYRTIPTTHSWVRSTDSSKAVVYGLNNIRLSVESGTPVKYPGRPQDYFNVIPTEEQLEVILQNQDVVQSWMATAVLV